MAQSHGQSKFQFKEPAAMEVDPTITKSPEINTEFNKIKAMFDGKDLSECFALMYLKQDEAIKGVRMEVDTIKTKVTDLEHAAESVQQDIQDIYETSIPQIKEFISDERKHRLKLDLWGRKWNLVVMGIPGTTKETPRESEKVFRKMLVEKLKFDENYAGSVLLQAVHRLPGGKPDKRNMIVRLNSLMERDEILEAARKLPKGNGIGVVPDLPPEISDLQSKLLKQRASLPEETRKKAKLHYSKEYPFVALKMPI